MNRKKLFRSFSFLFIFTGGLALAQNFNGAQPFQPGRNNFRARLSIATATPTSTPTATPTSTPTSTPTPVPYTVGCSNGEPDIAACFTFGESSGPIVDTVSGYSISPVNSPVYSQTFTGLFSAMTGIQVNVVGTHVRFQDNDGDSHLNLGTNDATIEVWAQIESAAAAGSALFHSYGPPGYQFEWQVDTGHMGMFIRADDNTLVQLRWVLGATIPVGTPTKFRIILDRSSGTPVATLKVNGVTQAADSGVGYTNSLSDLVGKAISNGYNIWGTDANGGSDLQVTYMGWRLSLNKTNNSGGPGGG